MSAARLTMAGPLDLARSLAGRVRELRLQRGWKQATLAQRAGVTLASYRRFETSGKASLDLVLKVARALARLEEFDLLFQPAPARSLAQLEEQSEGLLPRRGSR